jgi:hypothetical protein
MSVDCCIRGRVIYVHFSPRGLYTLTILISPILIWMSEMLLVIVVQICSQLEVSFLMYIAVPYLLWYVVCASLKPAILHLFSRSFSFSACVCRSKTFILLSSSNLEKYSALLRLMPSILSCRMWSWEPTSQVR